MAQLARAARQEGRAMPALSPGEGQKNERGLMPPKALRRAGTSSCKFGPLLFQGRRGRGARRRPREPRLHEGGRRSTATLVRRLPPTRRRALLRIVEAQQRQSNSIRALHRPASAVLPDDPPRPCRPPSFSPSKRGFRDAFARRHHVGGTSGGRQRRRPNSSPPMVGS